MNKQIKLNRLAELIQERRLSKQDKAYIYKHLNKDNQKTLSELLKEEVKTERVKYVLQEKHEKKRVYTVFNNAGFTAEFATQLGKSQRHKRIAILDTDRLSPTLELYFDVSSHVRSVYSHLKASQSTGLNLLVDAYHKSYLNRQYIDHLAIRVHGHKNLYYFSGGYLLEDYEYYQLQEFKAVIEALVGAYDILILHTNNFIYDAFTCYSLMVSDMNLLSVEGKIPSIRTLKKSMLFLSEKQAIEKEKNYYILYDHMNHQINEELFKELTEGFYLGKLDYSPYRHRALHDRYYPAFRPSRRNRKQMEGIISRLNRQVNKNEFNQ